ERIRQRRLLGLFAHRRERLGDRHPGRDEGGEGARRARELCCRDSPPCGAAGGPFLGQLGREDTPVPERLPGGARALGVDDAAPAVAGRGERPVCEDGHQPSSCVARSTSASVVTPSHTLASPSSRSVAMPSAVARRRTAAASARATTRVRIWPLTTRTPWI